jgi:hypothetical protein
MKAIVQDKYGSAEVLELREIDKPEIRDGEVLVRVRAAGVPAPLGAPCHGQTSWLFLTSWCVFCAAACWPIRVVAQQVALTAHTPRL